MAEAQRAGGRRKIGYITPEVRAVACLKRLGIGGKKLKTNVKCRRIG